MSPYQLGLEAREDGFVYLGQIPFLLPPKERAVLHILLQKWPNVVPKSLFADKIWHGEMSDESLVRCIAQVRQSLAPLLHIKIAAVYRQGYQLQISSTSEPRTLPALSHNRFMEAAKAGPVAVEALMHARTLMQQRTTSALQRAESVLRKLLLDEPAYIAAKVTFAECVAIQVSCAWGLRSANIHEALDVLEAIPEDARIQSGYFTEKANLLDCAWDFTESRKLHHQALDNGKCDTATRYHLGIHLLALGECEAAIEELTQACRLAPFSPALAVTLSRAHSFLEQNDKALAIVRENYRNHPDSSVAYVHMLAFESLVKPTKAIARQLRALQPKDLTWGFAHSSLMYGLARCGELGQAKRILDAHVHANPSKKATFTAGMILLGQTDEAIRYLSDAAALGCGFLPISLRTPENSALRSDPGFRAVFNRVFARASRNTGLAAPLQPTPT